MVGVGRCMLAAISSSAALTAYSSVMVRHSTLRGVVSVRGACTSLSHRCGIASRTKLSPGRMILGAVTSELFVGGAASGGSYLGGDMGQSEQDERGGRRGGELPH